MKGVTFASECRNCGQNIWKRYEDQGWLHANYERACRPTYAEPSTRG